MAAVEASTCVRHPPFGAAEPVGLSDAYRMQIRSICAVWLARTRLNSAVSAVGGCARCSLAIGLAGS